MNRLLHNVLLYLLCAAGLVSCTKKIDFSYDNRVNTAADASSSIRIVNLRGATELMVAGQKLSAFVLPNSEGYYDQHTTKGTSFFPETGRMGLTYNIPQRFVDAGNMATDIRFAGFGKDYGLSLTRGFSAKNDFNHPTDYYFTYYAPNTADLTDSLFAVPRSVSPPANPVNFKLRLLNLSSTASPFYGAYRIVWADGTAVPGLENIAPGTWSDYVEIPYGTYQLRVLAMDGTQVPGVGGKGQDFDIIEPNTGTMLLPGMMARPATPGFVNSLLTFAPLKTYQPGGVYTIVVADCPNFKNSTGGDNGETYSTKTNGFRIITDAEPVNMTYARIQAANVMAGKKIQVLVDDKPLGSMLPFAAAGEFAQYITGTHVLKAVDGAGKVLAEKTVNLSAADNQTAWVYEDKDGNPAISMVANNLSNVFSTGGVEDGSYNTMKIELPSWIRFMNFCTDLPEATFTTADGQVLANGAASQHLLQGVPLTKNAYAMMNANFYQNILAYASQPAVLPGDWLRNVPEVKSRDFIAQPELYKYGLPKSEPGVYTVALVGSLNSSKPGSEKARMIIVKHNK